jgi:hypothetical protein
LGYGDIWAALIGTDSGALGATSWAPGQPGDQVVRRRCGESRQFDLSMVAGFATAARSPGLAGLSHDAVVEGSAEKRLDGRLPAVFAAPAAPAGKNLDGIVGVARQQRPESPLARARTFRRIIHRTAALYLRGSCIDHSIPGATPVSSPQTPTPPTRPRSANPASVWRMVNRFVRAILGLPFPTPKQTSDAGQSHRTQDRPAPSPTGQLCPPPRCTAHPGGGNCKRNLNPDQPVRLQWPRPDRNTRDRHRSWHHR